MFEIERESRHALLSDLRHTEGERGFSSLLLLFDISRHRTIHFRQKQEHFDFS